MENETAPSREPRAQSFARAIGARYFVLLSCGLLSAVSVSAAFIFLGQPIDKTAQVTAISLTLLSSLAISAKPGLNAPAPMTVLVSTLAASFVSTIVYFNQIPYASIWGDVGVYRNLAEYLRQGGILPFVYDSSTISAVDGSIIVPPKGILNGDATGNLSQFHGLPTLSGVFALLSKDFESRWAMAAIAFVFVSQLGFLAIHFSKSIVAGLLTTALIVLSPLMTYVATYQTPELLMGTVVLATISLTAVTRQFIWPLVVGFAAYSLVHISFLLGCVIAGGVLFATVFLKPAHPKKTALLSAGLTLGGSIGLGYALSVSHQYTNDQIENLFRGINSLAYGALLTPLLGSVFAFALRKFSPITATGRIWSNFPKVWPLSAALLYVILATSIVVQAYLLGWTTTFLPSEPNPFSSWSARAVYANNEWASLAHLSILNLFLWSGLIPVAALIAAPFFARDSFLAFLLWAIAIFHVTVYSVYRIDIPNNYYASRYFFPVIVCLSAITASIALAQSRKLRVLSFIAIIPSGILSEQYLAAGFYSGDRRVRESFDALYREYGEIYFAGSDNLLYLLQGAELRTQHIDPTNLSDVVLISDMPIVGGRSHCASTNQRKIPWQIEPLREPDAQMLEFCLVRGRPQRPDRLEFKSNKWMVNGRYDFVAFLGTPGDRLTLKINSAGWWSSMAPFSNDLASIKPRLILCDQTVEASTITPKVISFEFAAPAVVCTARLESEVFVPSELGQGVDARRLGIDFSSIWLESRQEVP